MTARYLTASLLLLLIGLQCTDSESILTCSSSPQLTCETFTGSIIWVKRAYLARTLTTATPTSFCDSPTLDPGTRGDCVSSIDDVTNDVNTKCAVYQNCRLIVDYTLLTCNDSYASGITYLFAEYECLATQISGVNLPWFTLSDPRTAFAQPGISYFRSVSTASSSYSSQRGACRIQVPANTHATWRLFDLRGRLINLPSGCAFLLQIYTRSVYRQWCAQLTWEPDQFDVMTSNQAETFNLNFYPIYGANSEGKVWMSLNLTDSVGNQVNKINITCGRDIILDAPPTVVDVSTTSTTTTSSTTEAPPPSSSSSSTTTTTTTSPTPTPTTFPTTSSITTSTTSPTFTAPTPFPPSTTWLSSPSLAQPSTSPAPAQLSTTIPGVTVSLSTPLDAPGSSTIASIETGNGTSEEFNGTDPMTTLASSENKRDYTVWLIIGLTVGGGLLVIIFIIVTIAVCGYRKRRTNGQRQGDVIFAWERAETGGRGAASGESNDKTSSPSSAKPKVNTYTREPPSSAGIYLEIFPTNTDSKATAIEGSTRNAVPPHRSNNLDRIGQRRVNNARQSTTSDDVQINPVYGHLDLTNYVMPLDGVETTAAI